MKTIKAGKQLVDFLKLCYQANRPCLLVGPHGSGKSQISEVAAKELGINYIVRDLSLMEPPDLVGLPEKYGNTTRYLPPSFLPTSGKGLLVFEELNRCPNYMRSPCLQLLTARSLNDYTLPEGWLPLACINPDDSDYEVQSLDKALLSRFVKVQVVPDVDSWLEWAGSNGVDGDIIAYVGSDRKIFKDTCPRDWKYVSDLRIVKPKPSQEILDIAMAGLVGRERMVGFKTFLKGGRPLPKIMDLLTNYRFHRTSIQECTRKGETDKLDSLVYALKTHLQDEDNYHKIRESGTWFTLKQFCEDLIPDLAEDLVSFMEARGYEKPNGK